MDIYRFVSSLIGATTYCMVQDFQCLLIDAVYSDELIDFLKKQEVTDITVLLTHGHYDHILGILELKKWFNVTVVSSEKGEEVLCNPRKNLTGLANLICSLRGQQEKWNIKPFTVAADRVLKDGAVYEWNGIRFKTIYAPGHSQDSVCYLIENECIFVGDSLLKDEEITLRLPGGNKELYYNYTKAIMELWAGNLLIYPGHGDAFLFSEHTFYRGNR